MNNLPVEFHKEMVYGVEDDFLHEAVASGIAQDNGFTFTHAVGAITCGDGRTGIATLLTTAADNEFLSILSTNEIFEFVNGKPIRFVAKGVLPVLLPNQLNLWVGCMEDSDTATEMIDAGAGPRADSDMFGFYTPEAGGAVFPTTQDLWHCVSSFGALQQITPLNAANPLNLTKEDVAAQASGVGIKHDLFAEWVPTNFVPGVAGATPTLVDAEVNFWVDGLLVAKHLMRGAFQITAAATEEMNFGVVVKNITDISSLDVDYIKCEQLR